MWKSETKLLVSQQQYNKRKQNYALNECLACWSLPVVARCADISRFNPHRVKISLFTTQLISFKTEHTSLPANIGNIYLPLIGNLSDNFIYVSSLEDILELGALCVSDAQAIYGVIDRY